MSNNSIWPIDRTLSGATTLGQSGPGSGSNEGVLHIPKSSRSGDSPPDYFESYPGHALGGGVLRLCRGAVGVFYSPSRLGFLALMRNTWNHTTVSKLFVFDRNIWYHMTVYKLFELSIVTWSYNCLLSIIISYLKPYNKLLLMARETWVQSQVESYQRLKKWYLMPPRWTLSIIRLASRVKWSNPEKGVAPSPYLGIVAIEKRAFG